MMLSLFVFVALIANSAAFLGNIHSSTLKSIRQSHCLLNMMETTDPKQQHQMPKILTSGILSLSLLYGQFQPVLNNPFLSNDESSISFNLIQPAHADFRAQQKRTYFRFIPKFETGLKFYATDLKKAIDDEKFDVIKTVFEEFVVKVNPNDPNQIDQKDTYVNEKFYRPMVLFSGTFAERGTSIKQRLLLEQKDIFETAMGDLEGCIKDRREGGLFGKDIKMPTGSARKTQVTIDEKWDKYLICICACACYFCFT